MSTSPLETYRARVGNTAKPPRALLRARPAFIALRERLNGVGQRIEQYALNEHKRQKQLLESLKRMLENLSYRNTLKRGYSLVLSPQGDIISSTKGALKHERLILEFEDGQLGVKPK